MISKYIDSLGLQIDESYRGDCPQCGGKNTFTVTKTTDGILYNCYKLNCFLRGTSSYTFTVNDAKIRKDKKETLSKNFILPSSVLYKIDITSKWAEQYDIPDIDILYDVKEDRIVFPILHEAAIVDATGRAVNRKTIPKWKRYGNSGYPYVVGEGSIAVVVEDCISAAVVSTLNKNFTGVALLGTALLSNHIKELEKYSTILVALDPDAVKKTIEFTRQLRGNLSRSKVHAVKLKDDLKYRTYLDIISLQNYIY
tara:strand:+ start:2449 stop:3210 length:762 start_codon:yes stop_codon:yes gene_type:complete